MKCKHVKSEIFLYYQVRTFKTGISIDVKTPEKQPRVEEDPSYGYCEVKSPFGKKVGVVE